MPRWSAEKPAVAVVATADTYDEGYHKGDPGGLDAVDTDLAAGNIKDGVTIFGKLGTYVPTLVEDLVDEGIATGKTTISGTFARATIVIGAGLTSYGVTVTPTFAAGSRAVGVAVVAGKAGTASYLKLQVEMGGTIVAESSYIGATISMVYFAIGTRALSGAQACRDVIKNYHTSSVNISFYGYDTDSYMKRGVAVGSIKAA